MASSTITTIPKADCEQVDIKETTTPEPLQFCQFLSAEAKSPHFCIQRTARYAENPTAYLKGILGDEVFLQRRHQLCIPDEIDRDYYGVGKQKKSFERHIANLLGKKNGLFFVSGIQAQLAAMKTHCDHVGRNHVAWHVSSHLESAEEGAYRELYGLDRKLLGGNARVNPTVEEIKEVLSGTEETRPAAILLEVPNRTLGCKTYSFEELKAISEECRKAKVRLHCDGARIWEIEPYYQATASKSFEDIGVLFDSIYVSFYKGLQGSSGAILACDDADVVDSAKKWQKRAGGNVFTMQYQVIDAERGYNENIGTFAAKREKMIEVATRIKDATSGYRNKDGTRFVSFLPEKPTCCQTHTLFRGFTADQLIGARDKVQEKMAIRVFERLRPKRDVREQHKRETPAQATNNEPRVISSADPCLNDNEESVEWMVVHAILYVDTRTFVDGYVALCEALQSGL